MDDIERVEELDALEKLEHDLLDLCFLESEVLLLLHLVDELCETAPIDVFGDDAVVELVDFVHLVDPEYFFALNGVEDSDFVYKELHVLLVVLLFAGDTLHSEALVVVQPENLMNRRKGPFAYHFVYPVMVLE